MDGLSYQHTLDDTLLSPCTVKCKIHVIHFYQRLAISDLH